jgi:hypothetical protein
MGVSYLYLFIVCWDESATVNKKFLSALCMQIKIVYAIYIYIYNSLFISFENTQLVGNFLEKTRNF